MVPRNIIVMIIVVIVIVIIVQEALVFGDRVVTFFLLLSLPIYHLIFALRPINSRNLL